MNPKNLCFAVALAGVALSVQAESDINSSAGAGISASALLDMRVRYTASVP